LNVVWHSTTWKNSSIVREEIAQQQRAGFIKRVDAQPLLVGVEQCIALPRNTIL
jgi:hypothetical protein